MTVILPPTDAFRLRHMFFSASLLLRDDDRGGTRFRTCGKPT